MNPATREALSRSKALTPPPRIQASRWKHLAQGRLPRRESRGAAIHLRSPTLMTAGTMHSPHQRREAV